MGRTYNVIPLLFRAHMGEVVISAVSKEPHRVCPQLQLPEQQYVSGFVKEREISGGKRGTECDADQPVEEAW